MALSVVNQWTGTASVADREVLTTPTPGNWLIAVVTCRVTDASTPTISIGDVSRNLWTLLASETTQASTANSGAQIQAEVWACPAARFEGWRELAVYVGAMQIVESDVGGIAINVFEVAGMANGYLTVDAIRVGTASLATSLSLSMPAPGANSLFVGVAATDNGTPGAISNTGSGFSSLTQVSRTGPNLVMTSQWKESAAAETISWSSGATSVNWAAVGVALRVAGTAPAQPNPNWPGMAFQLGLGYDLNTPPSRVWWTSQPKRLLQLSGERGIQAELGAAQQGPTDIVLDNRDSALSPRAAGVATASAAGTTTTIKVPDAQATNINRGDFFRLLTSGGALKQFTVFQVVSTSSSGGTTTVTFARADGAAGGALAATATGDQYAGVPIDLYIPYRLLMTWGGKTYVVSSGWLRDLPAVYDGAAYSEVQAVAADALETLTAADVSQLRGEILRRSPTQYWPLDDAQGTAYAANASGRSISILTQATSKYGGGANTTVGFGASTQDVDGAGSKVSIIGDTGTGWAQDGLTAAELSTKGYALVGSDPTFPSISGGVTIFGALLINSAQISVVLAASVNPTILVVRNADPAAGAGLGNVLKFALDRVSLNGQLSWWDKDTHAVTTVTGSINQLVGQWHTWAITFTRTAWTMYIDAAPSASGSCDLVDKFTSINVGGEADQFANGRATPGTYAHVAVFGRRLSANEILDLHLSVSTGVLAELGTTFITRQLNTAGWRGTRVLTHDTDGELGPEGPPSGSVVDVLNEVAGYGDGLVFTDAASQLQYRDRVTAYQQTVRATFGERTDLGEIPYQPGMSPSFTPTFLYNATEITNTSYASDGTVSSSTLVALDEVSAAKYGARTLQRATRYQFPSDAWRIGWWLLARYAYPQQRVESITISAAADPSRWPIVLGVEVGDIVIVNKRPLGAPMLSLRCRVLQVKPTIVYGHGGQVSGSVTLTLAAAPSVVAIANDPVYGIVGNAVLGA